MYDAFHHVLDVCLKGQSIHRVRTWQTCVLTKAAPDVSHRVSDESATCQIPACTMRAHLPTLHTAKVHREPKAGTIQKHQMLMRRSWRTSAALFCYLFKGGTMRLHHTQWDSEIKFVLGRIENSIGTHQGTRHCWNPWKQWSNEPS